MKMQLLLFAAALAVVLAVWLPAKRRAYRLIDTDVFDTFNRLFPHARVLADVTAIAQLQERLLELNEEAESIQAAADAERRALTEAEQTKIDSIFAEFGEVEADIKRRERIEAQSARLAERVGRRTDPNDVVDASANAEAQAGARGGNGQQPARAQRMTMREVRDPNGTRWGWNNLGDFALAVRAAHPRAGSRIDPRLIANAPTSFGQEGVGEDGGFAVPPDFRSTIMIKVMGDASLIGRCDQLTTAANSVVYPKDETTPWQNSGGIQAYWEGEGLLLSQSKPSLKDQTYRLNKLTALVPVTEELMDDAPGMDSYLRRKVPEKFDAKLNTAIVRGTGVGMPQGILNADCIISVAKETSQVADTIVPENIFKMYSRMYGSSRGKSVWLINQDIEPQLFAMQLLAKNVAGTENVSGVPVYLPANALAGSPNGSLMGRPILTMEPCSTIGDLGDIILADLSQYMIIMKTGGIRQDVSMHLWFDYDTLAFRWIMRIAGSPWWGSAITPENGSNTRSCFVTLAERA
ncbi:MAG TPA: phage major capsid protein [Burkholderiales bacterium]